MNVPFATIDDEPLKRISGNPFERRICSFSVSPSIFVVIHGKIAAVMTSIILGQRTSCYNVSTFLITSGTVVTARHDRCVQIEDLILRIGPIRLRGRQRSSCHGYRRGSVSYSRANYQSILRTIFLTLQRSLVYKNAV